MTYYFMNMEAVCFWFQIMEAFFSSSIKRTLYVSGCGILLNIFGIYKDDHMDFFTSTYFCEDLY